MFNSQYYTCEQIDQRLLQGYLDDYNTENNTNLTKEQFLTLLFNTIGRNSTVDNLVTQIGYYECDTAGATAAKAITIANYALFAGGSMKVKFINKNTANNATLNINNKGAKALYYQGERASSTNSWDEGEVVEIYYDGTSYYANNVKGGSGSGVYDVSKEHHTSGPNSDGKFTLEYILNPSNVNELIPVNKRYPGMSIQFVSTSDNKYVQARCMAQNFTTDVKDWAVVPNVFEIENPEYFYVITDSKHRVFFGIKQDGSVTWIKGVPQPIKDYVENLIFDLPSLREKVEVLDSLLYKKEYQEFFQLLLDKKGRVIESIDINGKKTLNLDVFVAGKINDNDIHYENSVEYAAIVKDKNGKVFLAFKDNGEPEFGIKYPKFVIDTIINYLGDYQKFPIDFGMPKVSDSWLVVGDGCEGGMKPYCIAVGKKVLADNTGIKNITVGYDNMYQCTGHDNTSMGYHASFRNTSGIANAAFGSESQDDNLAGGYNASIGFCSLQRNNDGSFNVAIGAFALQGGQDSHYEDDNHKSYNKNTAVGTYALVEALHTSRRNVALGYGALRSSRVYVNNIAIGEEADCDKDNQTVIGNDSTVETIVRGDLIVKGTDGIKRQIVFNQDGTCSWIQVN